MKLTKVVVALTITALTLAGCYWTPPQAQAGGVSVRVSVPRGVVSPGTSVEAFRVYLYDAADVKALYGFPPTQPTPSYRGDSIQVIPSDLAGLPPQLRSQLSGKTIALDGYRYYDVILSGGLGSGGSFTIPDVLPGRKYRIHMEYGYYAPAPYFYGYEEGVSEAFEVTAGSVVDVALDLYSSYYGFTYGSLY